MPIRLRQILRFSVGGKVRAGLAVLILLGAGIGAVGLNGLSHLGSAVEETATAAVVLGGVNTAGSSVSSFIISHDAKEIAGASAALDKASTAAASLKTTDPTELAAITRTLDQFKSSLTKLQAAAVEMDDATLAMANASESLITMAQKAEETSVKLAEEADKNITNIQIDQDNIRNVAIAASKIQAGSFAIREAMTRYALGNPPADLEKARKAAAEMVEPADLITRMAGWPAHQKIVAEFNKATKDIIDGLNPKDGAKVDAFAILNASNVTINGSRSLVNALASDIDANAEHTRTSGDDASKARVVAGLARNFSDRIRIASTTADQYRINPGDDKVEAVNKALKTAGSFAKMLQKFNYPELGQGVATAVEAFTSLSAAKPKFDAAVTEARTISTDASKLISDLTESRRTNAASQSQSSLMMIGITGAAAVLFAIAVAFFLTRSIVGPIRALTGSMLRLASGDITSTIPEVKQSDEIGEMTKAIHVFRDNARERQELTAAGEREQAERTERQRRIERLIENFRSEMSGVLASVSGSADRMQETAQLLTGIADESSGQATSAGIASSEASSSVETVAASAEELSSSITEISHQVKGARDIVNKTSENAAATDAKTSGLVEAAGKIGNVVQLIRQVAEQTNLLALNATIEAARAGEAGRGFAVVAGEVKALANQTSRATDEIAAQIKAIQEATGTVVESIRDISRNMTEVSSYTESISSAVGQQSAATGEIARSVVRAADGTRAASSSVETLSRSVDETSQSAAAVLSVSHELNEQAATVTNMVESFLRQVAAA